MKRILIILGIAVLVLGVGLVALRSFMRRGVPPTTNGETTVDGALPDAGGRDVPLTAASPSAAPLSLACPESWVGLADSDNDELPGQVEALYHTDEQNPDTDGDGFPDGKEVRAGYDPLKKEGNPRLDSDKDGLTDDEECRWKTDPFIADTDGDGFPDGAEVQNGFDPTIRGDGQGSDALPARRAQQAEQAIERLRPDPNSENYTEGLAGLLTQGKPVREIGQTTVTPQQVQTVLNQARVNTALPSVALSELTISGENTPAALRAYLGKVDALRPGDFNDPTTLTNALIGAISGNTTGLNALRSRLSAYEQSLKAVPVPPSAVEHHRTLIAITRFINNQFGIVVQTAASDPAKTYLALRALQEGLPGHLQTLEQARAHLNSLIASGL